MRLIAKHCPLFFVLSRKSNRCFRRLIRYTNFIDPNQLHQFQSMAPLPNKQTPRFLNLKSIVINCFFILKSFPCFLSAQNMFKECREVGRDCYCRHHGRHPYTPRGHWLIDWAIYWLVLRSIDWLIDWWFNGSIFLTGKTSPSFSCEIWCGVEDFRGDWRRKGDFKRYRGCLVTPFPRTRFPVATPVVVLGVLCLQVIGTCNLVNHPVRRGWILFYFHTRMEEKEICIFSPLSSKDCVNKNERKGWGCNGATGLYG